MKRIDKEIEVWRGTIDPGIMIKITKNLPKDYETAKGNLIRRRCKFTFHLLTAPRCPHPASLHQPQSILIYWMLIRLV